MPCHTSKVFVSVSLVEASKVVRQLGLYASAAVACGAVAAFTGQALTWERMAETWRSEKYPLAYHVPADAPEVSG